MSVIERELPYFKDYLTRLKHTQAAPKYMREGIRRYKQPKRNACKISNNQYRGVLIDVPALMNRMKLNVYRGGKLVYDQADADRSLINPLITKRFNPKFSIYSLNATRMLSNMPPHKSSGKLRMIGSSVICYQDPKQLADRMKIIIGSMIAVNNSLVLNNDLSQINDELLKIGAN